MQIILKTVLIQVNKIPQTNKFKQEHIVYRLIKSFKF